MTTNSPSYYAVIPAEVRYCKNIEPSSKLLYGEITALCNKEGYCWASNRYFSELYEVNESTVKRWIKSLQDENFIKIETERKGFSLKRKIYINQIISTKGQKCTPEGSKMSPRELKNELHNNTSNITSKNKEREAPLPRTLFGSHVLLYEKEYADLCEKYGKEKLDQMIEEMNLGISANGYKYHCFKSAIQKWFIKEKQFKPAISEKTNMSQKNKEWVHENFKDGEISKGYTISIDDSGITFYHGQAYTTFKFSDFNFVDRVKNLFRKK